MITTKYKNTKCKVDGFTFDSKKEAKDYLFLKSRLKKGEIEFLSRQVSIKLADVKGVGTTYRADFVFYDKAKQAFIVWDSKGFETKEYQVKRAWLLDKFKGFIFVENKQEGLKEFMPYGEIEINFKEIVKNDKI